MWCWHHIKESLSGLCPGCRAPYKTDPHLFAAVDRHEWEFLIFIYHKLRFEIISFRLGLWRKIKKEKIKKRNEIEKELIKYNEFPLFVFLRILEIHLFYSSSLFYWHFLEILWLFIFLVFYVCSFLFHVKLRDLHSWFSSLIGIFWRHQSYFHWNLSLGSPVH